jgi:hypothetical protein
MNLSQVTIAPVFPLWSILVLFALGLAATFAQYRVTRAKLGSSRALGLSLLRLGAILFLVAFADDEGTQGVARHRSHDRHFKEHGSTRSERKREPPG